MITWLFGKLAIKFPRSRGKICDFYKSSRGKGIFPSAIIILWSPRETLRILPTRNLLFSGKQRISLSTNFPVHVNEEELVDKEILCLPLNFALAYHMHAENLEDKGKISLLHEQWGKYEVYIPSENKRIRGDHDITTHVY